MLFSPCYSMGLYVEELFFRSGRPAGHKFVDLYFLNILGQVRSKSNHIAWLQHLVPSYMYLLKLAQQVSYAFVVYLDMFYKTKLNCHFWFLQILSENWSHFRFISPCFLILSLRSTQTSSLEFSVATSAVLFMYIFVALHRYQVGF